MRRTWQTLAFLALAALAAGAAAAAPTEITVRVLASGAKFIGDGVGGVSVRLQDAETGELLAEGLIEGGTGDTDLIMRRARQPGESLATPGTAAFKATLDLGQPRRIRVTATGPMGYEASANTVSASRWILPGQHLTGDADWVLDMPGLIVAIEDPGPVERRTRDEPVTVRASVQMMCGCPLTPGGLWDADAFDVRAALLSGGRVVDEQAMRYGGSPSEFTADLHPAGGGGYEIRVTAVQAGTGNAGLARAGLELP